MNNIPHTQNQDSNLQLLAAACQTYSKAKCLMFVQAAAAFLPIMTALLTVFSPHLKAAAVFVGVIITFADDLYIKPSQSQLKAKGAKIQQAFDLKVLEMSGLGKRKEDLLWEIEEIQQAARCFKSKNKGYNRLKDWYDPQVGELPLYLGRFACQRINLWWDGTQRRRYTAILMVVLITTIVTLVFATAAAGYFVTDRTTMLEGTVLYIIAPVSNLVIFVMRQRKEHAQTIERLDGLRIDSNYLWTTALSGEMNPETAKAEAERLQDEIYNHRRKCPLVFDWLYMMLRDNHQKQMTENASTFILDFKSKLLKDG